MNELRWIVVPVLGDAGATQRRDEILAKCDLLGLIVEPTLEMRDYLNENMRREKK